jgi:Lipocalin-like domain
LFLPISITAAGLFYARCMDLVERTRVLIDAWNSGGPDEIAAFARDDVVLVEREDVLERDTILGRHAVVDRYRDRLSLVGPSKASLRSVDQLDAERVLAEMDLHFEGRVSGVEGEFRMVHIYTWDGDLLARIEEFTDVTSARGVVGTWQLVEWTAGVEHPLGPDATGRLIYSDDGFMAAFLARADGFSDALAYSGAWELRGGEEVVHHVSISSRDSFVGKDLVRSVSWGGADLVLTTPPTRDGVVNVLRWRREGG